MYLSFGVSLAKKAPTGAPRGKAVPIIKVSIMKYNGNKTLTPLAQNLRKNMTPEERHLWYDFLREHPAGFRRQKVFGDYILDFYSNQLRLAIELDGEQHCADEQLKKDVQRTEYLNSLGVSVLRFSNYEIDNYFIEICQHINRFINKLKSTRTVINESPFDRNYDIKN